VYHGKLTYFIFFSMHSTMSLHIMHSSGMSSFEDRSLRYPRWWLHSEGFSGISTCSSRSSSSTVTSSVSFDSSGKTGESWSTEISVKQYGQASYSSLESCCRFKALRGWAKTLPQESFGQVNVLIFLIFSSIWEMVNPPVENNY